MNKIRRKILNDSMITSTLERNFAIEISTDGSTLNEPYITIRSIKNGELVYEFPLMDGRWRPQWGEIWGDINNQHDLIDLVFRNSIFRLVAGRLISIIDNEDGTRTVHCDVNWGDIGGDINNQFDLQEIFNTINNNINDNSIQRLVGGRLITINTNDDGTRTIHCDVEWDDIGGDVTNIFNQITNNTLAQIRAGRLITIDRNDDSSLTIHADVNWGDITGDINNQFDLTNILNNLTNEITNINNNIGSMLSGQGEELVEGRDYSITYFNSYRPIERGIRVSAIVNNFSTTVFFEGNSSSSGTALTNPNPSSAHVATHEGNIIDTPSSWAFGINFTGEYVHLNTSPNVNYTTRDWQWSVTPNDIQATWKCVVMCANYIEGMTHRILTAPWALIDGFSNPNNGTSLYSIHQNVNSISVARFEGQMTFVNNI